MLVSDHTLSFCWRYSLPITRFLLEHVRTGVIIIQIMARIHHRSRILKINIPCITSSARRKGITGEIFLLQLSGQLEVEPFIASCRLLTVILD